jgi:hypothetical protein
MTNVYPKVLQSSYVVELDSPSPVMVDMINSCEALVYNRGNKYRLHFLEDLTHTCFLAKVW